MALIPPFFLDCVTALGALQDDGKTTNWIGQVSLWEGPFTRERSVGHAVYLVTNRHVVKGRQTLELRFNPETNEPARQFRLNLSDDAFGSLWMLHPDLSIDVCVIPIQFDVLKEQGIRCSFFADNQHVLSRSEAQAIGLSEGDGVYLLGFPMGIVGEKRNRVIVRQGCIARVSDVLSGESNEFLIDASVFPGNSGGPVITRPEITAIDGTKPTHSANLIGIVRAYLPYQDLAVSQQTQQPRIIFVENSGLASVLPYDFISEAIDMHRQMLPTMRPPEAAVGKSPAPPEDLGLAESALFPPPGNRTIVDNQRT